MAFGNEAMEAVEGAEFGLAQHAPLRRVGIDVIEVGEIRAILGLAVHGECMHRPGFVASDGARRHAEEQNQGQRRRGD